MCFNSWMGKNTGTSIKWNMIKRNSLSSHEKTWKNLKCMLPNEKSQSKEAALYCCNYMTFWKRQSDGDNKRISDWPGVEGKRRMNSQSPEAFQGSETLLGDTIMADACHYVFAQTHRMYTTRSEACCKLWPWVIRMHQRRFINFNKCGKYCQEPVPGVWGWYAGVRGYRKSLIFPLHVAVNLKFL